MSAAVGTGVTTMAACAGGMFVVMGFEQASVATFIALASALAADKCERREENDTHYDTAHEQILLLANWVLPALWPMGARTDSTHKAGEPSESHLRENFALGEGTSRWILVIVIGSISGKSERIGRTSVRHRPARE